MEVPINQKRLVCINYPGYITNFDAVSKSIGDEQTLTKVFENSSMRLAANLDPLNTFAKPVYGDRKLTDNALLIKVRVRRKKGASAKTAKVVQCEVLGVPTLSYEFNNLADFQYLPIERKNTGEFVDMQNELINFKIDDPFQPITDFLSRDLPVVVSPMVFSRFDRPVKYYFRPNPAEFLNVARKRGHPNQNEANEAEQSNEDASLPSTSRPLVPDTTRTRRLNGTQYHRFTDDNVPSEICPQIRDKRLSQRALEISGRLEELFARKPCWLTKALCFELQDNQAYPKMLLQGAVQRHAYLCYTGPWSRQWIRLGYDPRKYPEAKLLQTLDYRMPKRFVNAVVTFDLLSHQKMKRKLVFNKVQRGEVLAGSEQKRDEKVVTKLDFEIFSDELPTCYNTFSQLQDVHIASVQKIVHSNDGNEEGIAMEIDGWYPLGTMNNIRTKVEEVHRKLPRYKEIEEMCRK